MRVYLAGPFFNEEQRNVMRRMEDACQALDIKFYSPRLECYCPPNASLEERQKTFTSNVTNLSRAVTDLVLARIDDFDAGTMWEMGYCYAVEQPVYAYTTVEGRGLNLMLAQSCHGFLQTIPDVIEFLREAKIGNYKRAYKWKNQII